MPTLQPPTIKTKVPSVKAQKVFAKFACICLRSKILREFADARTSSLRSDRSGATCSFVAFLFVPLPLGMDSSSLDRKPARVMAPPVRVCEVSALGLAHKARGRACLGASTNFAGRAARTRAQQTVKAHSKVPPGRPSTWFLWRCSAEACDGSLSVWLCWSCVQ